MTVEAHTPGPWEAKRAYCHPKEWAIGRESAVSISGPSDGRPGRPVIAHATGLNAETNARLIAAAPDMLAALRKALAHLNYEDDCDDVTEVIEAIDDAIASATGVAAP